MSVEGAAVEARPAEEVLRVATFTVWKSDDPAGAQHAVKLLDEASSQGIVQVVEQAVVTWPADAARPQAQPPYADVRLGLWDSVRGVVRGTLVALPVIGGIVGAFIGTKATGGVGLGISHRDLARIRCEVTPGSSALFLITAEGDLDQLGDRFRLANTTLVHTTVST